MLCPRWGPRLGTKPRPRGRARLHRLACLLPGRSDRTGLSDRRIRPTRCGWRRRRRRNSRLLGRRSRRGSRAALRPLGLPAESEPGQEALFGRRRLRRIPYRYDTMRRLRSGSPWGRRRRITRLGLCGSIRRLAAGLRLGSCAEPAATALAAAEPAAIALAAAEAAGTGLAAADSLVPHPVSVASAVQGPVFVASAAEAPVSAEFADQAQVSGGSAECSGILRQRQAADGQRTQEAGP